MASRQTSVVRTSTKSGSARVKEKAEIKEKINNLSKPRTFTRDFQVYREGAEQLGYRKRTGELKNVIKWGQRKLALETIQFFTLYWDPGLHPKPVCLYVGAAPGCSINIMKILFPQIEWHLYDDHPYNRNLPGEKDGVFRYNHYFEDKHIKKWSERDDVFLLSDIRAVNYDDISFGRSRFGTGPNKYDSEKIVIADMFRQEKWVYDIDPVAASLKFRLPWIDQYYKDSKHFFPYLQGHAYYQPWLGATSTECRLVPTRNKDGKYYSVNWDSRKYEDAMFFHNVYERDMYRYINPFTSKGEDFIDGLDLTNDWDSLCETQILMDYLTKVGKEPKQEDVVKLSRFITNTLVTTNMCGTKEGSLQDRRLAITKPVETEEPEAGTFIMPLS